METQVQTPENVQTPESQVQTPETQVQTPETKVETKETPTPKVDVEKIQRESYKHAMDQIDLAIKEALGVDKPDGVKTSEYLKQILSDKGTKSKGQSVNDTTDDKDAIISALKTSLKEKEDAITELKNSTIRAKKELYVDSLIGQAQLNLPSNLSEQETAQMGDFLKRGLKNELDSKVDFKEVDGKFIAYKKDGQPYLDEFGDYLSPSKLLEREFSLFLAKPATAPTPKGTGGAKVEPKATVIPANIKSKSDYYEYLTRTKGYAFNSAPFVAELAKAKEDNPAMFK